MINFAVPGMWQILVRMKAFKVVHMRVYYMGIVGGISLCIDDMHIFFGDVIRRKK